MLCYLITFLLPFECGNNRCCFILLILFIILIIFGALSSMFDFIYSGFYSMYNASQLLGGIIVISYCFQSLWMFWIATKIDYLEDVEHREYSPIPITADSELYKLTHHTL